MRFSSWLLATTGNRGKRGEVETKSLSKEQETTQNRYLVRGETKGEGICENVLCF